MTVELYWNLNLSQCRKRTPQRSGIQTRLSLSLVVLMTEHVQESPSKQGRDVGPGTDPVTEKDGLLRQIVRGGWFLYREILGSK